MKKNNRKNIDSLIAESIRNFIKEESAGRLYDVGQRAEDWKDPKRVQNVYNNASAKLAKGKQQLQSEILPLFQELMAKLNDNNNTYLGDDRVFSMIDSLDSMKDKLISYYREMGDRNNPNKFY